MDSRAVSISAAVVSSGWGTSAAASASSGPLRPASPADASLQARPIRMVTRRATDVSGVNSSAARR